MQKKATATASGRARMLGCTEYKGTYFWVSMHSIELYGSVRFFPPENVFGSLLASWIQTCHLSHNLFRQTETPVKNILLYPVTLHKHCLHFLNDYISSSRRLINKFTRMKCPHYSCNRRTSDLSWLQKFFIQAVGISASTAELIQFHFFFVPVMVSHYPDKWAAILQLLVLIQLQRGIRFHHLCNWD